MLNPRRLPYCCWTLKERLITSRQWRTVQPFLLSVPWSPLCRFAHPHKLNHLCCLITLFPSIPDSSVWYCSDWSWEQPERWDYCLLNLCLSVCQSPPYLSTQVYNLSTLIHEPDLHHLHVSPLTFFNSSNPQEILSHFVCEYLLVSSLPQLFTDYGRLAMESSDVKPFQVLPNKEISVMTTCL